MFMVKRWVYGNTTPLTISIQINPNKAQGHASLQKKKKIPQTTKKYKKLFREKSLACCLFESVNGKSSSHKYYLLHRLMVSRHKYYLLHVS